MPWPHGSRGLVVQSSKQGLIMQVVGGTRAWSAPVVGVLGRAVELTASGSGVSPESGAGSRVYKGVTYTCQNKSSWPAEHPQYNQYSEFCDTFYP